MTATAVGTAHFRFSDFEVDFRAGELRRNGNKIKLGERPLQILAALLEHPGEVVTREELQKQIWPADTFVDFEHSINTAVLKLRDALGDNAEKPRYIETLPRHGYRFICPVDSEVDEVRRAPTTADEAPKGKVTIRPYRKIALAAGVVVIIAAALAAFHVAGLGDFLRQASSSVFGSRPEIRSIAVLPLENLSRDPQQEYFADGMTEALITDLSKIRSLKVISRTSAMQFKGVRKPLQEIARQLRVQGVIEGSVLRAGNRVRITVQLVHAATDTHLWAEMYDRELGDVLALHSELARAITRQVEASLTPQEAQRLEARPPVDPQAYLAYLKGRYLLAAGAYSNEDSTKARAHFEQAIEMDPSYAPSYAGLAMSYYLISNMWASPAAAMPKAKAAARKALELDGDLGEAHTALALVLSQYDWDWAAAERAYRRGIELNPSSAESHQWYGVFLVVMGRFREAEVELNRAEELDPLSESISASAIQPLYFGRRHTEAEKHLLGVLQTNPNIPWAHFFLGQAYEGTGRCEQAIDEYTTAERLGGLPFWRAVEIGCLHKLGRNDEALHLLAQLGQQAKQAYVSPYTLAVAYVNLGNKGRALDWLENSYRERGEDIVWLKNDPSMDPLRSEPRFQDLLRKMNFPS